MSAIAANGRTAVALVMLSGSILSDLVAGGTKIAKAQHVYRTAKITGLNIFYREAAPALAPVLLLLHGLPSSSRMF